MMLSHYNSLGQQLKSKGLSGQAAWFYGGLRDLVLTEVKNLLQCKQKSKAKILELGAGTCAFSYRLSEALGLE